MAGGVRAAPHSTDPDLGVQLVPIVHWLLTTDPYARYARIVTLGRAGGQLLHGDDPRLDQDYHRGVAHVAVSALIRPPEADLSLKRPGCWPIDQTASLLSTPSHVPKSPEMHCVPANQ